MEDFTKIDAHAVHRAMIEAKHQAKERAERMPSSAQALEGHAAQLKDVLNKILDRLPPEVRRLYPDVAHD